MDQLSHCLLGALTVRTMIVSKASPFPGPATCMVVTALAAVFPDIDYLAFWIDPLVFLADIHRGPTHSLILLPIWALLLGYSIARVMRQSDKWRVYSVLCAIGILTHIAADLLTVYGTQILYPLSAQRFSFGITFVVDPYFSAIVFLSLVISIRWPYRYVAVCGLLCLLSYLLLQTVLYHQAVRVTQVYADSLNDVQSIRVIPQPLSPFNWQLIVIKKNGYHVAWVNLGTQFVTQPFWNRVLPFELASHYHDQSHLAWHFYERWGSLTEQQLTNNVWQQEQFADFRYFAQLPLLYRIDQSPAMTCVWFTDLRYVLPGMTPSFRYGMCRQKEGAWHLYRLRRFTDNKRQAL